MCFVANKFSVRGLDIRFVDWSELKTARDQVQVVSETDVYVSGPGTGLVLSALLNDGR